MTASIFSKLSQQGKHRDLLESQDSDTSPIGNPKIGRTIAEFRSMNLDVRMVCGSCRTSGPLDLSALPKGADTESRVVAAHCPSCGSKAVSQEIVPLGSIEGPAFVAFVRVSRVSSSKSSDRSRLPRAGILPEDDVLVELPPILRKEIAEDRDLPDVINSKETEDAETTFPEASMTVAPTIPTIKVASVKTPIRPADKATAKAPAKSAPAKTPAKASVKPVQPAGKATAKAPAKSAPAKTPAKASVQPAGKTAAKASGKAEAKAQAKPAGKTSSKRSVKPVARR